MRWGYQAHVCRRGARPVGGCSRVPGSPATTRCASYCRCAESGRRWHDNPGLRLDWWTTRWDRCFWRQVSMPSPMLGLMRPDYSSLLIGWTSSWTCRRLCLARRAGLARLCPCSGWCAAGWRAERGWARAASGRGSTGCAARGVDGLCSAAARLQTAAPPDTSVPRGPAGGAPAAAAYCCLPHRDRDRHDQQTRPLACPTHPADWQHGWRISWRDA